MKFQFLRRAGALALALAMALTLTVPAWADDEVDGDPVPVQRVSLNKTSLRLEVGKTETLTATVTPDNATDNTVTWTSDNTSVATVSGGTVSALSAGTANITAKAGEKEDTCKVTVEALSTNGISITGASMDPASLTVSVSPSGAELPEGTFTWTITANDPNAGMIAPTFRGGAANEDGSVTTTDRNITLVYNNNTNAGEYTVKVAFTAAGAEDGKVTFEAEKPVTISGILLSGNSLENRKLTMFVGGKAALTLKTYGSANGSASVIWMSNDGNVVSVMNGSLTAYGLGKTVLIVTKGNYSTECTVEVVEDESVIADNYGDGYTASVSNPLKLSTVYPELKEMTKEKTAALNDGVPSPLQYINNLKVSTGQGTLYYLYNSEGDTGAGVGSADRFAEKSSGTILSADRLYFVPAVGFIGTAEITFNAIAKNGNFSGTIKVNVGIGPDGSGDGDNDNDDNNGEYTYQISYRARAGEPAWFMPSDFNAFCQSATGRSFSSVTFSMPKASEGVLYYNYMAGSGTPVTTTTKFTPSGAYTLNNVCFVPSAAYADENKPIKIGFRCVDSSGDPASGEVWVSVVPADVAGDPSNVSVSGVRGQPLTLQNELFNDACRDTIKDTLSFVTFKLPDPSDGVLYYNYRSDGSFDSRVTASTRCYYSGVPGLGNVTFVPGSGATGRIAISYIGYGSGGTSYSGTLYIGLNEADSSIIRYSVEKSGSVTFRASDFYNAGLYQKGIGVEFVELTVPGTKLGTLYYDYQSSSKPGSVVSGGTYYVSPKSGQSGLDLLSFHAAGSTGAVEISYKAYSAASSTGTRQSFSGKVVIQVGGIAAADVNLSCDTGGRAALPSYSLNSACSPVMGVSLSYIEITSVPASKEGRLYLGYNGFGTGTAVKPGDRFYYVGSPSIDRLTFVPCASFTGGAEITYIGYSGDGQKQASGRIVVSVSQSTTSRYFNDMSGYKWAIDSVDYLYWNGTAKGGGDGGYNPGKTITRGDFTLMLVRAYGFSASGSASYYDVPADSYYADAIRTASLLGVVNGYNGYFSPKASLTRQDAAVIIYNALNASGKATTNGLAADFSVYHDGRQIASYATEAMGSLVQMGILKGNGSGYLQPQRQLTRAEAAVLLHAIMTF